LIKFLSRILGFALRITLEPGNVKNNDLTASTKRPAGHLIDQTETLQARNFAEFWDFREKLHGTALGAACEAFDG
jgi:hypothetical protein